MSEIPSIQQIETLRRAQNISIGQLIRISGVPRATYSRLRKKPHSARVSQLTLLLSALRALAEANGATS